MLVKFINDERIKYLPINGLLSSGEAISNLPKYFESNPDIAAIEGWKELIKEDIPEYDSEKQYVKSTYRIEDGKVIQSWDIYEQI